MRRRESDWLLAVGGWRLVVGDWDLGFGIWPLRFELRSMKMATAKTKTAKTKTTKAMPKWKPAPEALVLTFEKALQSVPEAQPRKVFGYPAAFVNGQMLAGLHQEHMILRLSTDD